jgi:hypothetical protein
MTTVEDIEMFLESDHNLMAMAKRYEEDVLSLLGRIRELEDQLDQYTAPTARLAKERQLDLLHDILKIADHSVIFGDGDDDGEFDKMAMSKIKSLVKGYYNEPCACGG